MIGVRFDEKKAQEAAGCLITTEYIGSSWGLDYQQKIRAPVIKWCEEYCKHHWKFSGDFYFVDSIDALKFKLVWG